jgi:hypothetical protein
MLGARRIPADDLAENLEITVSALFDRARTGNGRRLRGVEQTRLSLRFPFSRLWGLMTTLRPPEFGSHGHNSPTTTL